MSAVFSPYSQGEETAKRRAVLLNGGVWVAGSRGVVNERKGGLAMENG